MSAVETETQAPVAPVELSTAELRALLDRTGALATREGDDPGHISHRWRKEILAILDAVDAGTPLGTPADPTTPQEEIEALFGALKSVLLGDVEKKFARAVWLIEQALPVMDTLNNARSKTWLQVAHPFLADGSTIRF